MAATGFDEVVWYHTGTGPDVPAVIIKGYDTNGDATTTYGSVVTADLLVLGGANTKLNAAKGTGTGQFEAGNAVG